MEHSMECCGLNMIAPIHSDIWKLGPQLVALVRSFRRCDEMNCPLTWALRFQKTGTFPRFLFPIHACAPGCKLSLCCSSHYFFLLSYFLAMMADSYFAVTQWINKNLFSSKVPWSWYFTTAIEMIESVIYIASLQLFIYAHFFNLKTEVSKIMWVILRFLKDKEFRMKIVIWHRIGKH